MVEDIVTSSIYDPIL